MKNPRITPSTLFLALSTLLWSQCTVAPDKTYEPTWESLGTYEVPEWFMDAKFGLFMHWGPQSLAIGHNGWVARHIYMQEGADWGDDYRKHVANYGHPSEFGYKDLIPLWKAERWEPDSLVAFYKEVGVRYIVPVAVHHDNFDTYASTYQPWNSMNMGPKRDVIGEWAAAARKHGLRFGVSSHNDRTWYWLHPAKGSDRSGPLKGVPYDGWLTLEDGEGTWWEGYDPQQLYAVPNSDNYQDDGNYMRVGEIPSDEFVENWRLRTKELIDVYRPDLVWFDGPMPMRTHEEADPEDRSRLEAVGLEMASYYYNQSLSWDGEEGIINIKSWGPGTVPDSSAVVMDIEKGSLDRINPHYWQAETSIGSWFYNATSDIELSPRVIIHNLCDIVSKNGNLLLNVGLKPDGTLPEHERQTLVEIGRWLDVHGEGIYGTRAWKVFGEVDTDIVPGDFLQNEQPMTARDIRYTHRDGTLYAFFMDKPSDGRIVLHDVGTTSLGDIQSIRLMSEEAALTWTMESDGLVVTLPQTYEEQHAYALQIQYSR